MKRPSFQFYPSDWLRDTALRTCSIGARGLWIDMICFMHEGTPYGYLKVNDKVILSTNLARMVGLTLDETEQYLEELKEAGVYQVENGAIYSKRMIRDENLRKIRAEGGKLGGNPKLKDKYKDNLNFVTNDKQIQTPSSSSSSSSSTSYINIKAPKVAKPDGISDITWNDYLTIRKAQKKPITETALKGLERESLKAKISLEDALKICCERNWIGFKADWIANLSNPIEKKKQTNWWLTDESVMAKGRELGINARAGESMGQYKQRIQQELDRL